MPQEYKVVLLGEGRVGKTSLISRFVSDTFDENQASTVQASMYTSVNIPLLDGSNTSVSMNIWDTAGQERFHALAPIYYRNASGAMLVYDVTDADTLDKAQRWLKELRAVVGEHIRTVICGNKADCVKEREVTEETAQKFAALHGAQHFSTSAKTGKNVADAFHALATEIAKSNNNSNVNNALYDAASGGTRRKRRGLRIDSDNSNDTAGNVDTAVNDKAAGAGTSAGVALELSSEDYLYNNPRPPGWGRRAPIDLSAPRRKCDAEPSQKGGCC